MAYVVSVTQTPSVSAASFTVTLGAHQAGDLLLCKLSQDGGGTVIAPDATSAAAGWAMIGTQAASGASRSAWAWLIADSASEVDPVFTGANAVWIGTCLVVRDAHATAPFGATPTSGTDFVRTDWNNVNSSASGSLTSAVDECLLIYSWNSDGNTQYIVCKLSEVTCLDKHMGGGVNGAQHVIGYKQQQAAGAAPTVTMYSPVATEGGNGWVLAIRNKSGGALAPDLRPDITQVKFYGTWETQQDGITWQAPDQFATTINAITCSSIALTPNFTALQPQTPWGRSSRLSSTENTAGLFVGATHAISTTDMTGKIFGVQWSTGASTTSAFAGSEGYLIGFSDGTNWAVFQIASREKGWQSGAEEMACIALGQATPYATSGSINWAAVSRIGYFWHRIGSTANGSAIDIRHAVLFGTTALTGGGSSRPSTFVDYQSMMNSWGTWRWAEIQGSSQIKAKSSLQIGDGTNVTYFDGATNSIGYPQAWSATANSNWQMDWNVAAGRVTLSVKASASDTIKLAAGAATTANGQLLTIDAASHASATYDFGQAFGGWTVTWDTDIADVGSIFTGCPQIAGKGADFTSVTIKNTTAGASAAAIGFDANGGSMTSSTIDVTGSSAGYHIELGTAVTAITLADVTFTGTPGTDKVHVLKTSGTVTITISGTTSLAAGDVTSAGATVVISAPQPTLDATVLANTRVVLWNRTTSAELDNTFITGTAWSKTITAGASANDVLDLYTFKEGYQESVSTIIYAGADATFAVGQATDSAIQYYRTEESVTDYTTLTEFNFYAPDIYIQSDDADGATALKRLFIFYNGSLTTEDGARYLRGGVTFRSPFDVVINRSVTPIAVDNVSATLGLYFTDEATIRVTTDDGTSWIAPPSAPGSIRYAFGVSPGQIETGVSGLTGPESAQLLALPSAAANADAVRTELTTELDYLLGLANAPSAATNADAVRIELTAELDYLLGLSNAPSAAANASAVRSELAAELAATLRAEKFARNKQVLNPATGARVVYDDDGVTPLGQGNTFMDVAGTQPYDGTAAVHRTERLA